jgi:hypothetical protein
MKLSRILLAAAVGTTFMTLYSYIISKKENDNFVEPELLNKLIDRSDNLPDIDNTETHPAGWVTHYAIGVLFVVSYLVLWKRAVKSPGIVKGLLIGAASGLIGIASWKIMFAANDNPPQNDRYRYFRQLFYAHLIFSTLALFCYKLPDYVRHATAAKRID